ncbi:hypothetical protein ACH5RR_012995 [Cinchona calisaya]|uniref:Uncharacterized protein n=1 Tax=Cinchona calisaya TaxID=153742 RepID=A0ABD2ZZ90_9GENT
MTLLAYVECDQHVIVRNVVPLADASQKIAKPSPVHVDGRLASQPIHARAVTGGNEDVPAHRTVSDNQAKTDYIVLCILEVQPVMSGW